MQILLSMQLYYQYGAQLIGWVLERTATLPIAPRAGDTIVLPDGYGRRVECVLLTDGSDRVEVSLEGLRAGEKKALKEVLQMLQDRGWRVARDLKLGSDPP